MLSRTLLLLCLSLLLSACASDVPDEVAPPAEVADKKIRVIFDTDANNELDDQHALAYLLMNGDLFDVEGVTVNATRNGGDIDEQYAEAERILELCTLKDKIPLLKGANLGFSDIKDHVGQDVFDGSDAVNFIIEQAQAPAEQQLIVLAVGKLTNVALALEKEPTLAEKMRVVWLGSNYPELGEYNQDNDTTSVNYVLNTAVPFEMVTVRYGKPSGTDAVRVTQEEVVQNMTGKGPKAAQPVMGRHGVAFDTFGDYAVNLFAHIDYYGDPPSRALFDMAAVAIVKDPSWAQASTISAPHLVNNEWIERPQNPRQITLWEHFDRDQIMADFYQTMNDYVLAEAKQ